MVNHILTMESLSPTKGKILLMMNGVIFVEDSE